MDIIRRIDELAAKNHFAGRVVLGFLIGPQQSEELRAVLGATCQVTHFRGFPVIYDDGIDGVCIIHRGSLFNDNAYIADRPFFP